MDDNGMVDDNDGDDLEYIMGNTCWSRAELPDDRTLVELWDEMLTGYPGSAGLIVLADTGVFWSNQVGGTACGHPEAEGFFVPLRIDFRKRPDPLVDCWAEAYDPRRVKELIDLLTLGEEIEPLTQEEVDRTKARMSEAWIPVHIIEPVVKATIRLDDPMLFSVRGKLAILTYPNSD